ncbi:hypothetical protein [Neptuniibacter sp.]|uniref:hypothetical protein n=1 Tax=Neptuniibacter sp. TaxID=1962643 RepID=UPI002605F52E|nr:hypothetical protein [Neptuniibacter sp.]MCP4595754.1 hypothetical protein [Neptuniibacter sp.]
MTDPKKAPEKKPAAQKPAAQKTEQKKTAVEFIKPHGRYVRGDIAGFDPETAEWLITKKYAVKPGEAPKDDSEDPAA